MCGCGRTSIPVPGAKRAGPMWSKKMNGPTILCGNAGQQPADLEAADVPDVRFEYCVHVKRRERQAAAVAGGCTGSVTVNFVPTPTWELTSILPPWLAMIL